MAYAAPATASFVGVGLTKTAAQSINNVTFTKLSWNTEDYDTSSFHDNSVNNERITIPSGKGGYYHIAGFVSFDLNATGGRIVQLHKNGSAVNSIVSLPTTGGSDFTNLPMSYVINLVATDYIELFAYQASGGALNVRSASNWQVTYLGA